MTGRHIIVLASLLALCVIGHTISENAGVIRFRGQIVESMCALTPVDQYIDIKCDRSGKSLTARYPVDAEKTLHITGIPTTRIQWLDKEKTLGIVVVSYE